MFYKEDIGIDLGTATVLVFRKGEIVLCEPSVVAIDKDTKKVIAVGEDARQMLGKTPGNIVAVRPLKEGVIADYDITEKMLCYFVRKVIGKKYFFKPRVIACIPTGATDVEERAVRQATLASGTSQAFIIEEPIAAALGAGLNIEEPTGNLVVDIGGGTSDIAVLSLGGIVCNISLRVGGDKFDEAIIRYIRKEHNLLIGERTAEDIKIQVGTAYVTDANAENYIEIRGRNLLTGLPKTIKVTTRESWEAMQESLQSVVDAVIRVLEITPPELAADIVNNGIVMTGGGALLNGLDTLISKETGLPVHISDDAVSCVVLGIGKALKKISYLNHYNYRIAKKVL